jgi:hypothetical protein
VDSCGLKFRVKTEARFLNVTGETPPMRAATLTPNAREAQGAADLGSIAAPVFHFPCSEGKKFAG